ncbi:MAG: hypothetical protein M0R00_01435 [Candidatus Omnitrophica bacterium]|jgi:hypothetical protein|nr:hypothetical protein [Candidatus Omnitrophota bacterium]
MAYWSEISNVSELEIASLYSILSYTAASEYITTGAVVDLDGYYEYLMSLSGIYTEGTGIEFPEFEVSGTTGLNAVCYIIGPTAIVEASVGNIINIEASEFIVLATGYVTPADLIAEITASKAVVEVTALNGAVITGAITWPKAVVSATSFFVISATGEITWPMATVSGYAYLISVYPAYRMNTNNFAVSQYSGFNFNSMCDFNGKILCAGESGIVEHAGGADNDDNISAYFQLPSYDYQTHKQKSFRKIYLEGTTEGGLTVAPIVDNIAVTGNAIGLMGISSEKQHMFALNHEDNGTLLGLKISNKNGSDFTINSIYGTIITSNVRSSGFTAVGRSKITASDFSVSASAS